MICVGRLLPPLGDRTRIVSACTYPIPPPFRDSSIWICFPFGLSVAMLVLPYLRIWLTMQICTMYVGLFPSSSLSSCPFFPPFHFTFYFMLRTECVGHGTVLFYLPKDIHFWRGLGHGELVCFIFSSSWRCGRLWGNRCPDHLSERFAYRIANRTVFFSNAALHSTT